VLERPSGDARHVEPGWWETFDFQGRPIGSRVRAGMYPDDMAVAPDGRHALVLTSGRAEGDPDKPAPALGVFDLESNPPRAVGRLTFDTPGDDPSRLSLSASGRQVAVALSGSEQVAAIDWTDREHPRLIGRSALSDDAIPYPSAGEDDWIMMPVASERDGVLIRGKETSPDILAATLPKGPGILFYDVPTRRLLGKLPMRSGALNLSVSRPKGLAFDPERGLLAVAGRSGSVHLIAIQR
jgi:glycerol-3-phosphate acyltransferase PlsY